MSIKEDFEKAFDNEIRFEDGDWDAALWAAAWMASKCSEEARRHRAAESPDELLPIEIADAIDELAKQITEP